MPTVVISERLDSSQDFTGVVDTHIKQTAATTNYGSNTVIEFGKWAVSDHTHGLVKFSGLSNITGPVTVSAASLELRLDRNDDATIVLELRRCLQNWVAAEATWNIYSTGNNWNTAGAQGSGTDISSTVTDSITLSTTVSGGGTPEYVVTLSSAQLAADVEAWINGDNTNNGWLIQRQGTGNDAKISRLMSSESTVGTFDEFRPELTVTYTTASGSTGRMLLLGVG